MKKITLVQAACLLACGASLSAAQAQSDAQDIPEIIVTASRSEQDLQTAPVGATIITRAQIESAGVVDANEAIRKIGGVAARGDLNGGKEYALDLRGFGATADNNTVVLVDGIRISENEQAAARLSSIAANSIERIEIIRGGASVMWGEGATAGVINIITRRDGKAGVSGQVGVGAETYGGRDGLAILRVGSESGKAVFDINARSNSSTGYRMNSQSSQDVVSMGLSAKEGDLSTRVRFDHESADNRFAGPLTLALLQADPRQAKSDQLNNWGTLQQTRFSTGLDFNFGAWAAIIDMGIKSKSATSNYPSLANTTTSTTTSNTTQLTPRLVYKGLVGSMVLTTNMGLEVKGWQYNNNGYLNPFGNGPVRNGNQTNRAAFVMTDWLFPTQTRLVAGYRAENIVKTSQDAGASLIGLSNNLTAAELSLNQTVQKGTDVYVRTAKSYRMANIDDIVGVTTLLSLLPQTSIDKEIGIKLRDGKQQLTVRYFLQNTSNEIAYDPNAGPISFGSPAGSNVNLDPTQRKGIELQGSAEVASNVTLSGNFQSIKAVFNGGTYAGNRIPLVSNQTATARVAYKLDQQQSVEGALRILGASMYGGDIGNACGKEVPSTRMFDALYRYKTKAYEIGLGVNNLTNVLGYTGFSYGCGTAFPSLSYYPDAGRTLRATLKYNF